MSSGYFSDCVVLTRTYSHVNSVQIQTGLWVENDFRPQVHIFNEDEYLFLSSEEWHIIYQEFKYLRSYQIGLNDIYDNSHLLIFKLLFCEKRCSIKFTNLVLEAMNTFIMCINSRMTELLVDYVNALKFINKVENKLRFVKLSSLDNFSTTLYNFACPNSLIELEIISISSAYFINL